MVEVSPYQGQYNRDFNNFSNIGCWAIWSGLGAGSLEHATNNASNFTPRYASRYDNYEKPIRNYLGRFSTGAKWAGRGIAVVGFTSTIIEISTGQKRLIGEGGLDLIMGGVGLIPGGGWIAASIYFGGKAILEATGNDFWN